MRKRNWKYWNMQLKPEQLEILCELCVFARTFFLFPAKSALFRIHIKFFVIFLTDRYIKAHNPTA